MNFIKCLGWVTFLLISGWLLEVSRDWHDLARFSTSKILYSVSILIPIFVFTFLGMLLNIKHLIYQFRSEGRWHLNVNKFISLALLPTLIIFLLELALRSLIPLIKIDLSTMSVIALIILGYYLVQSVYRSRT
ncbi:hypothetical protein ACFSUR_26575 [Halalkalibacter alkalisediminis]|uniref:hypothetical protein n=1 Tax=Halalkalibacter alkalisediminis TaxID=935616 RepID=UPI0036283BEA